MSTEDVTRLISAIESADNLGVWDIIPLVFSLIAIVLTIVQIFNTEQQHKSSIEADLLNKIFQEHLLYSFPQKFGVLKFNEKGKLTSANLFTDELNEIRIASQYYQYSNNGFYDQLKRELQSLEDFVVNSCNKTFLPSEQPSFFQEVQRRMEKIYQIINKRRYGKN